MLRSSAKLSVYEIVHVVSFVHPRLENVFSKLRAQEVTVGADKTSSLQKYVRTALLFT